jgi:putative two-component system response regulator
MDTQKNKLLIVDDEKSNLKLLSHILGAEYAVFTASGGASALEKAKELLMPDMDGWEVFNRLKGISLLQCVPIAFLTAINEPAKERHAFEIGAVDFITKPFEVDILSQRIESILKNYKSKEQTVDYFVISQ